MENLMKGELLVGEVGVSEEYINGKLISSRLVKLLSFDSKENEYRFQYDNATQEEYLTFDGKVYPYHVWYSDPKIQRKHIIKSIK